MTRQAPLERAALIELLDQHPASAIPCQATDRYAAAAWTSDEIDEQLVAAAACGPCPVWRACGAYGLAHLDEAGVYGGMTETQRRSAARKEKAA